MRIKTIVAGMILIMIGLLAFGLIVKLEQQTLEIEKDNLAQRVSTMEKEIDYLKKEISTTKQPMASNNQVEKNKEQTNKINWDDTSDWKTFNNQELGFSFKYPKELGEMEFKITDTTSGPKSVLFSGKEFKGRFRGAINDDKYFRVSGVTKNFSKGTEGGFGVFAGYYVEEGKYYFNSLDQFADRKDEIVPTEILQINGKEVLLTERTAVYGDVFHQKGAYINLNNQIDFPGLAVENKDLTPEQFEKILATFSFAD